jgi:PhoPQ-activated pathogenicity-related protein
MSIQRICIWSLLALSVLASERGPLSAADAPSVPEPPAALFKYVKAEDPAYRWELKGSQKLDAGTIYDLALISQEWQGIPWDHQLQVYVPAGVKPTSTMLLWNQGGTASEKNVAFGLDIARRVQAPVAFLYGIPKQPLFDGKKEDTLIAETFVRFLETKDDRWPLLFPMVKSLVRAMDTLQEFSKQEWKEPLTGFVVSGGSKRGWTTWLTGASDPRVKAIAPMVIDTLNMKAQGPYQLKSFGKYSDQIIDYTARGLMPIPNTDEARLLWTMVDPWVYRSRLTMPKMVINGANDPYWTTDALNLYWDDLPSDKWVTYVPNAGHGLEQQFPDGHKERDRGINSLAAFARHVIRNKPMPKLSWKHDDASGKARLTVTADPAPKAARLWVNQAATRDFRLAEWKEAPAKIAGQTITGEVSPPTNGATAFFAELDYEIDELPHQLSTQMRILDAPAK